jgi:C_GCAxxG_C_C family probable redox protein
MSSKTDIALEAFGNNFNCAQSVFSAFSEDYNLPRELAFKISSGLGGGVRCGEICGAATGAVLVIGLNCGHYVPGDLESKEHVGSETAEFMRRFKEKCGGCVCRELLGIDITTPENRMKAKEMGLFNTVCRNLVKNAVEILEDMGY